MAVKRIWHGWTTHENAGAYRQILFDKVIPGIKARNLSGYRGIEVFRRELKDETEFITIMTFDSLQDVKDFLGENYKKCHVPAFARRVLKRWDEYTAHYESVDREYA